MTMSKHHWTSGWISKMLLAFGLAFSATGIAFAGQESTIFKYDGHDFIREQTTLAKEDGSSAVNTKLDRNSPAYTNLVKKLSYNGEGDLFGQKCHSYYAPLTEAGKLTGAIFVAMCSKQ
jgi:methyl-accepting chemotaxis protein